MLGRQDERTAGTLVSLFKKNHRNSGNNKVQLFRLRYLCIMGVVVPTTPSSLDERSVDRPCSLIKIKPRNLS